MKLNIEDKNISLYCPNCKGVEFITNDNSEIVTCNSCELSLEKDELIEQNKGEIEDHIDDMKEEIKKSIEKQLKDIFKKWN